jgi:hypothetical protein
MHRLLLLSLAVTCMLNFLTCNATCSSDSVSTLNATYTATSTSSGFVVLSLAWTSAGTKVGSNVVTVGPSGGYSGFKVQTSSTVYSADVKISFTYTLEGFGCNYGGGFYPPPAVVWFTQNGVRQWSQSILPISLAQQTNPTAFSSGWTDISLTASSDDTYGIEVVVGTAINSSTCTIEIFDVDASSFRVASPTGC